MNALSARNEASAVGAKKADTMSLGSAKRTEPRRRGGC